MANYATLKAAIQQVIKTNGNNEITGAILQSSLLAIINSLGADYQYVGIATPQTDPGMPDQNVFYLAGPGTYTNFGAIVIPNDRIGTIKYNGNWSYETIQFPIPNNSISTSKLQNGSVTEEKLSTELQSAIVHPVGVGDSGNQADLDISDENANVLVRFQDGHVKTKNFDSSDLQDQLDFLQEEIEEIGGQTISTDKGNLISSARKGAAAFINGEAIIYNHSGTGMIEYMFFAGGTGSWNDPANAILDVTCDGVQCVHAKLYELAALSMDIATQNDYSQRNFFNSLFAKNGQINGLTFNFKIPYQTSCIIKLIRAAGDTSNQIWCYVCANTKINLQFGCIKIPGTAKFKAIRQANELVAAGNHYTLFSSQNKSALLGVNLFMDAANSYSLEGCVRAYDGNGNFQYLSSGLEDFFLATYYFNTGLYQNDNAGVTYYNTGNGCKLSAYRLYMDAPICFNSGITVKVRNGDNNFLDDTAAPTTPEFTPGNATFGAICFYYEWE